MLKVKDIVEKLGLKVICGEDKLENEVKGGYACDLLSWVMSHGSNGDAWITVQVHPNVIAVAVLLEFSCIIIPESIEVEALSITKAVESGIPILQSEENAYKICGKLKDLGI